MGWSDRVSTGAAEAAKVDLLALVVPPGLDKTAFIDFVGARLLERDLIGAIDRFVRTPRRFGEIRSLLQELQMQHRSPNGNPSHEWQTLMRWLLFYIPGRYELRVANYSEIFSRFGVR